MPRTKHKVVEGFACEVCRKFNRYPAYVYAHWTVLLNFTCACGQRYSILEGTAQKEE